MNYLNELNRRYGCQKSEREYQSAVAILKNKLDSCFAAGKSCCTYFTRPEILDRIMKDPEFEGFKFKETNQTAIRNGYVGKLIAWD